MVHVKDREELIKLASSAAFCEQSIATMMFGHRLGVPALVQKDMLKCLWENPSVAFNHIWDKRNIPNSKLLAAIVRGKGITLKTFFNWQQGELEDSCKGIFNKFCHTCVEDVNEL